MPSRSSLATAAWKQPNFLASMRYVVRLSHLSEADKRAYVLADNKLAEKAGWDRELLAIELQGLIELDVDVELTGFDMAEIDLLFGHVREANSASGPKDKVPEPSLGPAVSQTGDLWLLGSHRLLCGDGDPTYVDVAVRRWQAYTGQAAILAGSGETFETTAERRAKAAA